MYEQRYLAENGYVNPDGSIKRNDTVKSSPVFPEIEPLSLPPRRDSQSFRSANVDEDIKTIKALIKNNFEIYKNQADALQSISNVQDQLVKLTAEIHCSVAKSNEMLEKMHSSSKESDKPLPSPRPSPRGVVPKVPLLRKTSKIDLKR